MYRPMQTGTLITLALYFLLMIGIGLFAWKRSTDTSEGYMLAGRNLHPAVAALSAGASRRKRATNAPSTPSFIGVIVRAVSCR